MGEEMHISAIISEYNPFHNGHKYHIEQTKRMGATHIVAIMGGNFLQRGTPAVLSKWARAKSALLCGADLILDLPVPWATASAEKFAYGAVAIANALGCVNTLSFGSECGDLALLRQTACAAVSPIIQKDIRINLETGINYAAAREKAIEKVFGSKAAALLHSPNNTLAIEYIKALDKLQSAIVPYTVARSGAAHDSTEIKADMASASFLRGQILSEHPDFDLLHKLMPMPSLQILKEEIDAQHAPVAFEPLERAVLAKLRCAGVEQFASIPDVSEGLENRIYEAVRAATSMEDLFAKIKTKRYTHARIRRIILSSFLGIESFDGPLPYIRVLGFNERGKEVLRLAKATASLPIVTRAAAISSLGENAVKLFALENRATDLYALAFPKIAPCGLEMTMQTVRV